MHDHPSTHHAQAVLFSGQRKVELVSLPLVPESAQDVLVKVDYSGVSTGTERMLWEGSMPMFPGLGYPLVPGYESIGTVVNAPQQERHWLGRRVYVKGAKCFGKVHGLFGSTASYLSVKSDRLVALPDGFEMVAPQAEPILLALAATAQHMLATCPEAWQQRTLIVGHGVLGRLLARLLIAQGGSKPTVWEKNPARMAGQFDYPVLRAEDDSFNRYDCIWDVSGDSTILDALIARIRPGGQIVLGGFYSERLNFSFAPAFMREARLCVAAQWQTGDLNAVIDLVLQSRLSLAGLLTHEVEPAAAPEAYRLAFEDPSCLKLIINWCGMHSSSHSSHSPSKSPLNH